MSQTGPRDLDSVLASRYVLTDKGLAALAAIDAQKPQPATNDQEHDQ